MQPGNKQQPSFPQRSDPIAAGQPGTAAPDGVAQSHLQNLREKCEKAPRHGVNGKYLIIQAARLLAQQEQAGKGETEGHAAAARVSNSVSEPTSSNLSLLSNLELRSHPLSRTGCWQLVCMWLIHLPYRLHTSICLAVFYTAGSQSEATAQQQQQKPQQKQQAPPARVVQPAGPPALTGKGHSA